ncbi:MAG: anaerobic ribonucleoside-triphosphate reductase, partial [Symbiobacteriaceae bacterium]|nr:anaerobic ribonucleoside-triphosphate reductase [Symbiobacteriaceae bacterium]
ASETLLLAYENGLGRHEQPIFPNIIWKMRSGVSIEKNDPNYDLFQLALKVCSTRLFPSFVNQDASFNRDFPEDVPTMGCRTRVSWDLHSPDFEQTCSGRGNVSYTTLNLVGLALKASRTTYDEDIEIAYQELQRRYPFPVPNLTSRIFLVRLEEYLRIGVHQLMQRLEYQGGFTKRDFPFLMQGVWKRSELLRPTETVGDTLKHGTLSLGFIGLAEALTVLVGKHHGESPDAQSFGLRVITLMRSLLDEASSQYHLNFSLLATPAEGLTGKLVAKDKAIYGIIPGVTDKEWYTNSYHVPVEYGISILEKISVEGPYHSQCNAGHISYIELDASPKDNLSALEKIIQAMRQADMGYMSINFPVDRCRHCQYQGFIDKSCPVCGSKDIAHIRRITGYLAELEQFNAAKKAEERSRVRHGRV